MLNGIMLLWFLLTALSLLFVMIDIRTTPASPVLKWGFILLTAYLGPLGAFLYVLGCREPLPGLHERYVATRWRQVLGSTMHCVAGDGVGILAGAVIASLLHLSKTEDIALEYVLGFGFGWSIFQALFMRGMAGGSYRRALSSAFIPELLSMNFLMAAMVPTMLLTMKYVHGAHDPAGPAFWFVMSMSLLVGFVLAYPMNWWLVSRHLKHGMMTVRVSETDKTQQRHEDGHAKHGSSYAMNHPDPVAASGMTHGGGENVSNGALAGMTVLSVVLFALGIGIAAFFGGFS